MISIAIAGSTNHTLQCAKALFEDKHFQIAWVLTPSPREIGRKKVLTKNPMHVWAEENEIPTILVEKKIDEKIKAQIQQLNQSTNQPLNYLLVVDFGYLIPKWLLEFPQIMPVNIHPSALPKYRGSSPGQFTLLFGEKESAVSVIKMNEELDEGDLIYQEKFNVPNTMTLPEYYSMAFDLIAKQLPQLLVDLTRDKINLQTQPIKSPTPIARRLTKEDGFIEWGILNSKLNNRATDQQTTNRLLQSVYEQNKNWFTTLNNAIRAFSPWPGVWTIVPTNKGDKRMKVLEIKKDGEKIELKKAQLEGLSPTSFEEIKKTIVS